MEGLSIVYAADVTAPSKDNIFTLTVKNIGSVDMEGVNVTASVIQNPDGLITIKDVTPTNVKISAGGSQDFKIKFDVACPPEGSNKTETAKFKFKITTTTPGPFYRKDCGIGATCQEVEADFTVEEKLTKCETCSNFTRAPKNCDDGDRCTDDSCDPATGCRHIQTPGCDTPDDNEDVGNPDIDNPDNLDPTSNMGILTNGFFTSMASLAEKLKEKFAPINIDFSPTILTEHSLLVIPSGGLYGLDSSPIFKANLEEYIKNGGTVVVFAQQHGYEYGVLPGDISAYGWLEDQSCQYRSTYIDTYHQILSGQDSAYADFYVDGYFTKWPENSTILLRRAKNGMPAMLMYEYGKGRVIVSSIYEDWGYTHGQYTEDGRRLIRDLLSWARDPKVLPEFSPGASANVPFNIINSSDKAASQIRLTVLNPDKNVIEEKTIAQSVSPGETANISHLIPSIPTYLGIWFINYTLLDADGNIVQPEMLGERFVVSDPKKVPIVKEIAFSITSDAEHYPYGGNAIFTIHIWNNTDVERNITCQATYFGLNKTVTVPAHDKVSFAHIVSNVQWAARFRVYFYDESGMSLGSAEKGYWVFYPSLEVRIKADREQYRAGEDVSLSLSIRNKQNQAYTSTINLIVLDPDNMKIFEKNVEVVLPANALATENIVFTLPATSRGGAYIVRAEAFNGGNRIGSGSTYFQVPEAYLGITPVIPGIIQIGTNPISFNLENVGLVNISGGTLEVSLKDPTGTLLWTNSQGFDLPNGTTISLDFAMPVDTIIFGTYKLAYKVTYDGKTINGEKELSCSSLIEVALDKSSYRVRETMNMDAKITNTGRFQSENMNIQVSIPDMGYSSTETMSLSPNQSKSIPFSALIPGNLSAGTHQGTITLTMGNSVSKNFSFSVPQSKITLTLGDLSYEAGDTVYINTENSGGVDTSAEHKIKLADKNGIAVFETETLVGLIAGEVKQINFAIPENIENGDYQLLVEAKDLSTNETTKLNKTIHIAGLIASLEVRTDKQVYLGVDPKTSIADFKVSNGLIDNGNLDLKVFHVTEKTKTWTTQEDWQSGELHRVDITTTPGDAIADDPILPEIPAVEDPSPTEIDQTKMEPPSNSSSNTLNAYGKYLRVGIDSFGHLGDYSRGWGFGYDRSGSAVNFYETVAAGWWGDGYVVGYDSNWAYSYESDGNYNLSLISETINEDANLAQVVDITQSGNLNINQTFTLEKSEKYLRLDVVLTNTGSTTLTNVSYVRVTDWDIITGSDGYDYLMDSDNLPIVMAWNNPGGSPMYCGLAASSTTPNTSFDADSWADYVSPYTLDNYDSNGRRFDGNAGLGWHIGDLAPGASYNITLYFIAAESKEELIDTYSRADGGCWVTLKHDAGKSVEWKTARWEATTPETTKIKVATRTAGTKEELASSGWSGYSETSGAAITSKPGRWIEVKALFDTKDPKTLTPILHELSLDYMESGQVWGKDMAISVVNTGTVSVPIDTIEGTGKFILQGTIYSALSQLVATDTYSFYVDDGYIHLTFETDKKVYKPGETVNVNGQVANDGSVSATALNLVFKANETTLYSETFDLPAGEMHPFTFSFVAPDQPFTLSGFIDSREISDQIEVEKPELQVDIAAPDIAGRDPFNFIVNLTNPKRVDANINLTIAGESQGLTIPAGQSKIIEKVFTITNDITIYVILSGDVSQTIRKDVIFGEALEIKVAPASVYPEGLVSIPYTVRNMGQLDSRFDLNFNLNGQTSTKNIFVPVGQTLSDSLSYNLATGEYTLTHSSFFGSGSAGFKVARYNQLEMALDINYSSTPSVLILKDAATEGDFNTILTDAGMDVTVSTVYEYQWNGTNPSPNDFDVVILLDGNTYGAGMPIAGQEALVNFVNAGGGLIMTEWIAYEAGNHTAMKDLILYEPSQWNYAEGEETFTVAQEHPVTLGLPPSFSVPYHAGNPGGVKPDATVLISGSMLPSAVAVKQYGAGRVVEFAVAGNYTGSPFISSPDMQKLLINSVNWTAKALEKNKVRADVGVTNVGYNNFDGQLRVVTDFFADTSALALNVGETKSFNYDFDPTTIEPGIYNLVASALHSGNVIKQVTGKINILGAEFELTSSPANPVYTPGQEATMTFKIKNTGMVEGEAEIRLTVIDLLDETRLIWIAPGMEREIAFTFQIPDDLPEKEYKAILELNGETTEIPFLISGVKISVVASLDKTLYNIGDTGILTLDITNKSSLYPEMYAKASSNSYEDIESFTLSDHNTIQLSLPVDESTPDRISYGIYLASGRAVYLNSIFIRLMKDTITLYTDKGVYKAGDTVTVFVETTESGDLWVSAPGYKDTIAIAGSTTFNFTLPEEMVSDTYSIKYQFGEHTGVCNFNVEGYSGRALEVLLNKVTYDPVDTMNIRFTIEVNQDVSAILKGWVYDPRGGYSELFETTGAFKAGENKVDVNANLTTYLDGIHRIVYALYKADTLLSLLSGAEAFDVRQAAIISLITDKTTYGEADVVIANVRTFAAREYMGQIDLFINGSLKASQGVTLIGEGEVSFELGTLPEGEYTLVTQLHADEVISEKQTTFSVFDVAAPVKPSGLSLRVEGNTGILSWNVNTEADLAGYNVYRNGIKLNAVPLKWTAYQDEGIVSGIEYRYYLTAVDKDGNESEPSAEKYTTLDNTPPVITISPATGVTASVPITVSYSVTDNLDPSPIVTANYPSPTIFNRDGVYTITVEAQDHSGNMASKSITITLTGLNQPPTINLTSPIGGEVWAGIQNITWSANDPDGDPLTISIDYSSDGGASWLTLAAGEVDDGVYSWHTTTVSNGSNYLIRVTASDGKLSASDQSDAVFIIRNNLPPAANAGPNQNVITNELVTLNGSESYDPEGAMITFLWTFVEIPAGSSVTDASLSDVTSARPTFIPDMEGTYRLELIVNDGVLDSTPDEVEIIAATPNVAPNANAGLDQNVFTGETVYLNGSGSNDPDNGPQPLSYMWSFVVIPSLSSLSDGAITGRDQTNASFITDVDGTYVLRLTISDSELLSEDTVQIIATTPNVPPNANAGADITIYLGETAILNGSASNDPDNGPAHLSYSWRFVAVPTGSQIGNEDIMGADTVSPSFTPDVVGTYVIELMVSDSLDAAFDNVAVTVIPTGKVKGGAWYVRDGFRRTFMVEVEYVNGAFTNTLVRYLNHSNRLSMQATSISSFVISGTTATIEGNCTVNSIGGYTFWLEMKDTNLDSLSLTIKDATGTVKDSTSGTVVGGDFTVTSY